LKPFQEELIKQELSVDSGYHIGENPDMKHRHVVYPIKGRWKMPRTECLLIIGDK
jgi:hypothetical protein